MSSKKSKNQVASTEESTPAPTQEAPPVVENDEDSEEMTTSEPPVEVEATAPKFDYEIAPGRSLTSLVGILGPGCEVKESHFSGGATTLKAFVESGYILDNTK